MPGFDFRGVLAPEVLGQFHAWLEHEQIDQRATNIARGWAAGAPFRFKDGIDVSVGTEYHLVKALLETRFGIIDGGRQ